MNPKTMKYMGMASGTLVLLAAIIALVKVTAVGTPLSLVGEVGLYWALPIAVVLFGLFYGIAALSRRAAQEPPEEPSEP